HQENGTLGNASVGLLPGGEVGGAYPVIAIGRTGVFHIHHHSRRDQVRYGQLVNGGLTFGEVNRTVDVRPEMLARGIPSGGVPVASLRWPPRFPLEVKRLCGRPVD